MGIDNYKAGVRNALWRKQSFSYWVGIGRTTAWPNEAVPPAHPTTNDDIEEPIVYVQPDIVSLCMPVSSGEDFTINGQGYALVADVDAYTEMARWIYVKALFKPSLGQPYADYRQKAIFSGLTPKGGYESETWLAPANVLDVGLVEYTHNSTVRTFGGGEVKIEETVIDCL